MFYCETCLKSEVYVKKFVKYVDKLVDVLLTYCKTHIFRVPFISRISRP